MTRAERAVPTLRVRFCSGCGRPMVPATHESATHDPHTGEKRGPRRVLVCPRYNRSWRNLWLGGWTHTGLLVDDGTPFGTLEADLRWL